MMAEPEWHGWAYDLPDGRVGLTVGHHPYRKQVALMAYIPDHGLDVLGYFRSESAARCAVEMIDAFLDGDAAEVLRAADGFRLRAAAEGRENG